MIGYSELVTVVTKFNRWCRINKYSQKININTLNININIKSIIKNDDVHIRIKRYSCGILPTNQVTTREENASFG